jgi:NAD(P)-dependent dehydrogenase (short-subunit alcohol dehydrogenase family)
MEQGHRVALVTGANRGLGLETAIRLAKKNYKVYLSGRNLHSVTDCCERLQKSLKLDVLPLYLDVTVAESIAEAIARIEKDHDRIDVLVNNAGILLEKDSDHPDLATLKDILEKTFETNVVGSYLTSEKVLPIMLRNGYGRIVNVSGGMGQLINMQSEYPAYRISKAAMNGITRIFAVLSRGNNILVNSVCPGWVKTDMGGSDAPRSLAEGVETIIWAATLEEGGPTGGFFRDKHPIPW